MPSNLKGNYEKTLPNAFQYNQKRYLKIIDIKSLL